MLPIQNVPESISEISKVHIVATSWTNLKNNKAICRESKALFIKVTDPYFHSK